MTDFIYKSPTEFVFGKGAEAELGRCLHKYGAQKILVHYGGKSAKASGLLGRVFKAIAGAGMSYVELGGVQPNPRLTLVREGIDLCRKENVDFLLAIGGGSVIDSLKAISIGLTYSGDVWDFFESKVPVPDKVLPIGVILTIPAAGSEGSPAMVVTNEAGQAKYGITCEAARPAFAIMNPELTYSLPDYQTACGATDMMAHVLERYFTNTTAAGLNDRLSESLMKTIMEAARAALADGRDYNSRADLMWASTLAHVDLLSCGRVSDWSSHTIEHELSAFYDVAHGAGLAVIFPAWMKHVYRHDIDRFCQFAVRVFNVEMNYFDREKTALAGIAAFEGFLSSIGMPVRLEGLGITDNRFEEMSGRLTDGGKQTLGNFVPLSFDDCKKIYELAV